jgi:hypothetical protein
MLVAVFFGALLLLTDLFAVRHGGWSERAAAGVSSGGAVATLFVAWPDSARWHHVEPGLLVVDVVIFAAFIAIMIRSNHFWPMWTTSFQLLSIASQLGPAMSRMSNALAFALDEQIWSWLILIQILGASHARFRRRA